MSFAVAYYVPHNEGLEVGIINDAGFDSDGRLVDLYEVDASIKSFPDTESARAWLVEQFEKSGGDIELELERVPSGWEQQISYEY